MARDDGSGPGDGLAGLLWRYASDAVVAVAADGTVLDATPAAAGVVTAPGSNLLAQVHPEDGPWLADLLATPATQPVGPVEVRIGTGETWQHLEVVALPPPDDTAAIALVAREVTESRRLARRLAAQARVVELLAAREPIGAVLHEIARMVEEHTDDSRVAVLLARGDDLELAAAPRLPAPWTRAAQRMEGDAERLAASGVTRGPVDGHLAELASEHSLGRGWLCAIGGDPPAGIIVLFPATLRFPTEHEHEVLEEAAALARFALDLDGVAERAEWAVRHDVLTGAVHRLAFFDELDRFARHHGGELVVVLVRVEGLAAVNLAAGYDVGNEVLREVAGRLRRALRGGDVLARFAGRTFAVAGVTRRPGGVEVLEERLRAAVRAGVDAAAATCPVEGTVVGVRRELPLADPTALVAEAEQCLRQAGAGAIGVGRPGEETGTDGPEPRSGSGGSDR